MSEPKFGWKVRAVKRCSATSGSYGLLTSNGAITHWRIARSWRTDKLPWYECNLVWSETHKTPSYRTRQSDLERLQAAGLHGPTFCLSVNATFDMEQDGNNIDKLQQIHRAYSGLNVILGVAQDTMRIRNCRVSKDSREDLLG